MRLVLYGFHICPFVEQIAILIREKQLNCEKVWVDIRNKPDWFSNLSPLGKVPILSVDGKVIFESYVINEFLEEIFPKLPLHPHDPVQRAQNRAWILWGNLLTVDAYNLSIAPTGEAFLHSKNLVESKLEKLEMLLQSQPYFNGEQFCLIDLCYAPLFYRLQHLAELFSVELLASYPKLQSWSQLILLRPSVISSFTPNFAAEFKTLLALKGSYLISNCN